MSIFSRMVGVRRRGRVRVCGGRSEDEVKNLIDADGASSVSPHCGRGGSDERKELGRKVEVRELW